MSRSMRAHLLLTAVVFTWGATFAVVKRALVDVSPLLFNLLRMLLALACLLAVYGRHLRRLNRESLLWGAVTGGFLAMGYQFQTAGLRLTTPSKSAFLTGLVVVLVPLLSFIPRLRAPGAARPGWTALAGAGAAFFGIVLLTTPAGADFGFAEINRGDLLSLGCAVGFALHVLALAHGARRVPFARLAVLQIGFCTLAMAITTPLLEHPHLRWTPAVLFALLIAGCLATAAAFTIQTWAQQFLPAAHTALILALEPVFAWLTSYVFLGERLGSRASVGALLVLGGIAISELIPSRIQPTAHEGVPLS